LNCGLDGWKETIILAARLHDAGKADPRFQSLLRGGDVRAAAVAAELLAKSDLLPAGWRAYQAARERAGYPAGGRHELLSVRLAESAALPAAEDRELFLHLIASHHGRCRPFAPVVDDAAAVDVALTFNGAALNASSRTELERLDSGVAERFWRLVRRYGWWGLAYQEALLRLADHRASEAEQQKPTA
jgi:CRISPR-associated endonuclease/helicase Cas3